MAKASKAFGTFSGVFVPTLLTILGVIMYLRLGWLVGHGGLLGGLLVVGLAMGLSLATGLSLSSIATNTRLGAGGPYAVISRSLGLEVGGSVGVPLYLSQALAVVMYIFGLREGWCWIFPSHSPLVVDLVAFAVVFGLAFVSASLAFRVQYVVMAIIAASLVSVLAGATRFEGLRAVELWGTFPPEDGVSLGFWGVFAVFFPAATGIMAGANMSGELENPRRSIPLGTLTAIGVALVIYVGLVLWATQAGSPEELRANMTLMVDRAMWGPLVLAGLLGATFSSALTSMVGAPRILLAMSQDKILPGASWLSRTWSGEPRVGMLVTGAIVLLGLLLRDLNVVAPLITMFFLITYATINGVMVVESGLGLVSFRPTLKVPMVVPLLGLVGCVFAMFIVNPVFSLVAIAVVVAIYVGILWRGVDRRGDVRSGLFVAVAEWAVGRVIELGISNTRAWKPDVLLPVDDPAEARGDFQFVLDYCRPEGSVKLLGMATPDTAEGFSDQLKALSGALREEGLLSTWSVLDSVDVVTGVIAAMQALESAFLRPNVLFLNLSHDSAERPTLEQVITEGSRLRFGMLVFAPHPVAGLGRRKVINLWLRPQPAALSVQEALAHTNMNLGILSAYRLVCAWDAELNLICAVAAEADRAEAERYIGQIRDLARIPPRAKTVVEVGDFAALLASAPQSDLDIIGMRPDGDLDWMRQMVAVSRSACLFTRDSGTESALA